MNIIGLEVFESPGISIAPPGQLEITYGQKLRITTSFAYRGPAIDITLYGAIGNRGWAGFDEIINAEANYKTPESRTTFVPVTATVDIPITAAIDPKPDYDIYCKIKEYSEAGHPQVDDVITITGLKPTFKLLEETIYPYAYIYEGDVEISTFTFTTIPFTPASWISGLLATHVENEVKKAGGRVMELRVYVDENLLRPWTNWRIEVVGTPPPIAASIGYAWWAIAILAALAIIAIIAITWSITTIVGLFKRNPALEDVKPTWGKETLIGTIQDSEKYWKRTPTPTETLGDMSEQELRDYLDKIATEEMPKGIGWGTIAVVGALGLGAVALLASTRKRKE